MKKPSVFFLVMLILGTLPTTWAQEPLPLDQTYVSSDGVLTFDYPTGWIVQEDENTIMVSNIEEAVAADEIGEGEIGLSIWKPSSVATFGADVPEDVLAIFADTVTSANDTAFVGPITQIQVGDRRVVQASIGDDSFKGVVLAFDLGDENMVLVLLFGLASDTAYEDFEPTLFHIIESIVLADSTQEVEPIDGEPDAETPSGVALTESFSGLGMTINYPEGWIARETAYSIEVVNDPAYIGLFDNDPDVEFPEDLFMTTIGSTAEWDESYSIAKVMQGFADILSQTEEGLVFEPLRSITVNEFEASVLYFANSLRKSEGEFLGIGMGDRLILVFLQAHQGHYDEYKPIGESIVNSIRIEQEKPEPSADDSATSADLPGQGVSVAAYVIGRVY